MDSNPSENKARGGILDLNSAAVATATEQPEALTSIVDLDSGASGVVCGSDGGAMEDASAVGHANFVGEQVKEADADHDDVGKKDSADDKRAIEIVGGESRKGYPDAVDDGDAKVVIEAGAPGVETNLVDGKNTEDKGDGAVDANEVKVSVEVAIGHADNAAADEKSMAIGDDVNQEVSVNVGVATGSDGDQAVKIGGQDWTARSKRGRPRKLIDKGDAVNPEVGVDVGTETGDSGGQDVLVRKQESTAARKRGRPRRSGVEHIEHAGYRCPFQDEKKAGFAGSDLVWGKVRSHPWWPGQIFDPSNASEMALSIQKKDHHLVAYFGDKTFVWCDESRLKHFQTHYSQMEKQSSTDVFVTAVNVALQEVSRRIELGMTCHCFMDETYASLKDQKVENAGIREGTCCSSVDKSCIISSFEPLRLINYIQTLAQLPYGGIDRLELAITMSQLKAFYHSKGYAELPLFVLGEGLEDNIEGSPSRKRKSDDDVADPSTPTSSDAASGKGKLSVRGSSFGKEKHVFEHGRKKKSLSELMEKNSNDCDADENTSGYGGKPSSRSSHIKHKVANFGPTDSGKGKKKKLDSLGDMLTKSQTSSPKKQPMVGERMCRVAGQMAGSTPIIKQDGKTLMKIPTKESHRKSGVGDALNQTKTPRVVKSVSEEYSSPDELLAQLCFAAGDPLEGYSCLSTIASFFTDFRSWAYSSSSKDEKHTGTVAGKKGRRKSASGKSASLEMSTSDYTQDSYWSDIIVSEEEEWVSSGQEREVESQKKRRKKQQPANELALCPPLSSMSDSGQHFQDDSANPTNTEDMDGERCTGQNLQDGSTNPTNNMQDLEGEGSRSNLLREVDEYMPTALVLTFNESDDMPAVTDLIKIFGQYGPLREAETEVVKLENHAKVIFKRRSDAEVALRSAGKCSIFGHTLVSYRLRFLEPTSKASLSSTSLSK